MPAAIIQSSGHIRHAGKEPANRIARVVLPLPGSPVSTASRPIPPDIMSPPGPSCQARRDAAAPSLRNIILRASIRQLGVNFRRATAVNLAGKHRTRTQRTEPNVGVAGEPCLAPPAPAPFLEIRQIGAAAARPAGAVCGARTIGREFGEQLIE